MNNAQLAPVPTPSADLPTSNSELPSPRFTVLAAPADSSYGHQGSSIQYPASSNGKLAPKNEHLVSSNGHAASGNGRQASSIQYPASSNGHCPPSDEHPVSSIQNPPAPRPRSRNGKIARLPFLERDMVNRMLRDHIPYDKIRGALEEHGIYATVRNISNWKTRGGYKEWSLEQDRALENRLLQDNMVEHLRKSDASQLPEVGLQIAATSVSQFFLKSETQLNLSTNPAACRQMIADLCRLSRHIHTLQKYRDESAKELSYKYNPERVLREAEKSVELTREVYSAARLGMSAREPDVPRRNFIPKQLSPELPPPLG